MSAPITEFRMCVHPFCAVFSPSVANYILKRVGRTGTQSSTVKEVVERNFYVDDILTSTETVEEASAL